VEVLKWLSCLIGLAILAGSTPVAAQPPSSEETRTTAESGQLHGVVFGPHDRLPLQGVVVEIDGETRATTNTDGAFQVSLTAGAHRVRFIPPNRIGVDVDEVEIVAGQTTEVIVEFRADGPAAIDIATPGAQADPTPQASSDGSEATGEPGTLTGRVDSREDGEPVGGAQVIVRGADGETTTAEDGTFELELPPGTWDVSVVHAQYSTGTKRDITVESGESSEVTWELTPAAVRLSAHTVTIPKIEGGNIAMTRKRKESSAATDVIGAEEMSKSAESTAAGALKQVTGLTVVGGKYVYVRGLGSRYASSLLDGSTLPSPEPEKRVVPLDLFPTSMLQSVTVQKTYTPDMPGEFGGGVVQMKTREYPDEFSLEIGLSSGGNTETTFRRGLGYQGGSTDWLGVDDGTRQLPREVEEETDGKALSKKDRFGRGNFTAEEIESMGESLPNNWNTERQPMIPDLGLSLDMGDSFELAGGTEVGFRFGGTYDNSYDIDEYETTSFVVGDGELQEDDNFEFEETTHNITTSGILSGGVTFDENNKVELTSLLTRVTDDETTRYEGFYSDHGGQIRVTQLRWLERQMMFHQLRGEHELPELGDLKLNWRYVFSRASRHEPDRRLYRYDYENSIDGFALSDRPEGNTRLWSELQDNNHDGGLSAALPVEVWNDLEATLKVGADATRKDRTVDTRRFKFSNSSTDVGEFSKRPEQVFSEENIGPDGYFELRETTRATDNYRGSQTLLAGYAMADIPIIEKLETSAGARLEYSDQQVETFALFADKREVGRLETTDVLPALNLTWSLTDEMQARAGVSRTVNRPNFRELSNAAYTEVVGGRTYRGNPDLDRASISHADARWEWYPDRGESVSVGAFYKDFRDPIEVTYKPGATPIVQPANVSGARNFGIEFQGRTGLDAIAESLRDFYIAGNIAFIDSSVQIDPDSEEAELLTNTERPLQGQSPYVLNAQIGWDDADRQMAVTLLYNVFGPRIAEVGIYGIPDVIEQPDHTLDLTFSKTFDSGLTMKAKAKDLLDVPQTYTQGGRVTYRHRDGRSFSVGLSYGF